MRSPLLPAVLALLSLAALPCAAQERPPQDDKAKPASRVVTSGPTSGISKTVSASLTAKLPKYQPPPPEQPQMRAADPTIPETGEEEALPEDKPIDADQPMNKIIRLPRYVVQGDKPPVFKEQEIYTKSALARIAVDRYLSRFDSKVLNRFTLPFIGISPEQRAMMMYEEDKRLQDKADIERMAKAASMSGDKAESEYLKKESNKTFMRSQGAAWSFPKD